MPHIHDQIDFVVSAFIVHSGRVLLVDHRELGLWLQPGGHGELDEDTDQALWREIEEETGLAPSQLEILSEKIDFGAGTTISLWPPRWVNIHRIHERHRHIGLNYLLCAKSDALRLAEREHNAIRWFSAEGLDDPALNTPADTRFYGREAIRLAA
ncbi:MAG: NUDIX domain-containing protein [Patescibacteria group bacterium]|mgnify:FL=1